MPLAKQHHQCLQQQRTSLDAILNSKRNRLFFENSETIKRKHTSGLEKMQRPNFSELLATGIPEFSQDVLRWRTRAACALLG